LDHSEISQPRKLLDEITSGDSYVNAQKEGSQADSLD